MILDKQNIFMDNVDVKSSSRVVSNVIDGTLPGNALEGAALTLRIQVTAAFTRAAGAIDSVFTLETYSTTDFSSARTVLWSSGVVAKADLAAGAVVASVKVPPGVLRYLAVVVDNVNAADAANIDAFLTPQGEQH